MALIQQLVKRVIKRKTGDVICGTDVLECDICIHEFKQDMKVTRLRRKSPLAQGRDICVACISELNKKNISNVGTKALSRISVEDRKRHAKAGGIASSKISNSGRFNTDRWNNMSAEDQQQQVRRANAALQEKLKDPIKRSEHFSKVLAQLSIGYMSKGHIELHDSIQHLDFASHAQISNMQVDECNERLKIVIEYNGDMWHCNPRTYKADDYNPAIKMSAGQKWANDIARKKVLQKMGYRVVVIWESDWLSNKNECVKYIEDICNEVSQKNTN